MKVTEMNNLPKVRPNAMQVIKSILKWNFLQENDSCQGSEMRFCRGLQSHMRTYISSPFIDRSRPLIHGFVFLLSGLITWSLSDKTGHWPVFVVCTISMYLIYIYLIASMGYRLARENSVYTIKVSTSTNDPVPSK